MMSAVTKNLILVCKKKAEFRDCIGKEHEPITALTMQAAKTHQELNDKTLLQYTITKMISKPTLHVLLIAKEQKMSIQLFTAMKLR